MKKHTRSGRFGKENDRKEDFDTERNQINGLETKVASSLACNAIN